PQTHDHLQDPQHEVDPRGRPGAHIRPLPIPITIEVLAALDDVACFIPIAGIVALFVRAPIISLLRHFISLWIVRLAGDRLAIKRWMTWTTLSVLRVEIIWRGRAAHGAHSFL